MSHFLVVGGGAAGFFAAIRAKEVNPSLRVTIIEKSAHLLSKVKVSGGGRCNVTHACFDPEKLVENYPRGKKELLGPFHRFAAGDTMEWFESRGVPLKIEQDGRVFPISDRSESVINCLMAEAVKNEILIITNCGMESIGRNDSGRWVVKSAKAEFEADYVMIATGSSPKVWNQLAKNLKFEIIEPVPSLFTFHVKHDLIRDLSGISVPCAIATIKENDKFMANGPILVTHWGLSGPAILKLSAWGARWMSAVNYQFNLIVNWIGLSFEKAVFQLKELRDSNPRKYIYSTACAPLPLRLWQRILRLVFIDPTLQWSNISTKQLQSIASLLTSSELPVCGKSTNKDEFVTAGGISLKEIDFKTFSSKKYPNLFAAGEVLDIDAVTGGFNFQAGWTGGYIVGESVASTAE